MDDSVRLRPRLTSAITSVPALAWKERVYTALLQRGCHHDEVSIELSDLILPAGLGLLRPLSLLPPPAPPQPSAQKKAAAAERRDKLLLRHILEEDPVFDVRCNNQLQRVDQPATQEAQARAARRGGVLQQPAGDLSRSVFDAEWAVFLRERPGYSLSVVGVSSRYIQGAEQVGSRLRHDGGRESDAAAVNPQPQATSMPAQALRAENQRQTASSLQDLKTGSGLAACGVVLRRRRVRHLLPPAPYSAPGRRGAEVDGRVLTEGQLIESREDVIWEWRHFVGSNSTRLAAEYTALAKALELCARKGFAPLEVFTDTEDISKNLQRKSTDEDEMLAQLADLDTKTKQQEMAIARSQAAASARSPNPHPAIKGGSAYIFGVHKQCVQHILHMQAQTQVDQHRMPEYYNILGLPTVPSQRRKNPTHTNPAVFRNAAKTRPVPLGQLLQVEGKPSEFVPWSDEMFARTAVGKYCSVPWERAVTFTVLAGAGATPERLEHSWRLAGARALARRSQEDGLLIARGFFDSAPEPLIGKEPADQYNSLKKSTLQTESDPALGYLHVGWLGETRSGCAALDTACNRGLLPGARTAAEQVGSLACAWDGKVVGAQPEECEYAKFPGAPTAPLLQSLLYHVQPAHYLRCPCHADILNTYCEKCNQ